MASGFLLQIIVLRMAGALRNADAYFATAAILQVALSITVHVVSGALMPHLSRLDQARRVATTWRMLALVGVLGLPIVIVLGFTAPVWTFLIFPGLANGAASESVGLATLAVLAAPFAILTSILSGFLYAERRFVTNEAIALATAIALALAAGVAIPRYGIVALGWLIVARFALQTALLATLLPFAKWRSDTADSLRAIGGKARALLAGALYFKSDLLVDRYLLSLAPAGALSVIVFGQSIFMAAAGVLGQSLANTATPALSVAHETGDKAAFRAILRRNLGMIAAVSVGLLLAGVVLVPPIAALLTTKKISSGSIDLRWVLILFGGLPIGACIGTLLANALYALGDTRTPTLMTVLTFTIFLTAKILVFSYLGLYAFCILTSVYYLTNATLLGWLLQYRMSREFAA